MAKSSYEAHNLAAKDDKPSQPTPPASSTRATMGFTPVNGKFSPQPPPNVPAPYVLKSSSLNPHDQPPQTHAPQNPPQYSQPNPSPYAAAGVNPSSYAASNPSPYAAVHSSPFPYASNPSPYAAIHSSPYPPPSNYHPPANAQQQPPPQNVIYQNTNPQNMPPQNMAPQNMGHQNMAPSNMAPQNMAPQNMSPQNSFPPKPESSRQQPPAIAPSIESYHEVPIAPAPPPVAVPSSIPDKFLSPSPEKEPLPTFTANGASNNGLPQDPRGSNSYHANAQHPPVYTTDQHQQYASEVRQAPQSSHGQANFQSQPAERNNGTPHRFSTSTDFRRESVGTPVDSKRPVLHFAIQDESGAPDDAPGSMFKKKQLWDMDIAALFTTVAQKAGKSSDELSLLTFRCQWEPASIVVSKYAGDDAWKRQKKKINSLFISAQAEFPEELSFEVWVFCGDRLSKKVKKRDTDDDVD
jgi:hypothetical protein